MLPWSTPETAWLVAGVAGYVASAGAAWRGIFARSLDHRAVLAPLGMGAALLAVAVAERWLRLGHGPFLSLYELLLSNLLTLGVLYALAYWRIPQVRPGAVVVLPILLLLGVWTISLPPDATRLPASYDNPWLWIHVSVGKIFLAACLTATGIAVGLRARSWRRRPSAEAEGDSAQLDAVAWRFMALAFVFHSLMLLAGAAWARDAWGRFWAWDPLETWAFVTWLVLGTVLHLRITYEPRLWIGWLLIVVVFVLAVLTFFGVPFVSVAAHKGVM
jgi:ABC-type transport system involved in cytochrome c biogenesis permease subunit